MFDALFDNNIIGTKVEMTTTRKVVTQVTKERTIAPVARIEPFSLARRLRKVENLFAPNRLRLVA